MLPKKTEHLTGRIGGPIRHAPHLYRYDRKGRKEYFGAVSKKNLKRLGNILDRTSQRLID